MVVFRRVLAAFSNQPPQTSLLPQEYPSEMQSEPIYVAQTDNSETEAETDKQSEAKKAAAENEALQLRGEIFALLGKSPTSREEMQEAFKKYLAHILNSETVCSFSDKNFLRVAEQYIDELTFVELQECLDDAGVARAMELARHKEETNELQRTLNFLYGRHHNDQSFRPLEILRGAETEKARNAKELQKAVEASERRMQSEEAKDRIGIVEEHLMCLTIDDVTNDDVYRAYAEVAYERMAISEEKILFALGLGYREQAHDMFGFLREEGKLSSEQELLLRSCLNPQGFPNLPCVNPSQTWNGVPDDNGFELTRATQGQAGARCSPTGRSLG